MNFKRVSTAAMALAMTASLGSAALAADLPQGWTPADGARGPMLISTNPNAGSYDKTITINDEVHSKMSPELAIDLLEELRREERAHG